VTPSPPPPPRRPLGRTGLEVSALGLGGGPLGDPALSERESDRLVRSAIDAGITLLDAAPSYGESEARLGRILSNGLRERIVLSTKLGYGVPGVPDWTGDCIRAGVDQALRRLRTGHLDIAHLHSCPLEVLERGDVVEALARSVAEGTVRVAAYSGDGDALAWAIASGAFGAVQLSLNPWDQAALDAALPTCRHLGLGVVAKRSLANAIWTRREPPAAPDLAEYHRRFKTLALHPDGLGWAELAVRFTAWQPGVSSCLIGTRNPERLVQAARFLSRGPLPGEVERRIRADFRRKGAGWRGV